MLKKIDPTFLHFYWYGVMMAIGAAGILLFMVPLCHCNAEDPPSIKIASIYALSGVATESNRPSVIGVREAVTALNRRGGILGRPIKLIEIDNLSTPIGSQVAAQKAARMGVCAIIGSAWSSHSMAVARVAQEEGIPMISNISTHPQVTEIGNFVFRICFTDDDQGEAMARFAGKALCAKRAVICVNLNSNYSLELAERFREIFEASGGIVSSTLEYKNHSTLAYFQTLVDGIKALAPDVVFIPGFAESGSIVNEMVKKGVTAKPLGGDGWDFGRFFETGGASISRGYYCTHWTATAPFDDASRDDPFYRQGDDPIWAAEALGVDAMNLLAKAIEMAGTDKDRDKLRRIIAQMPPFKGVTGEIQFDAVGNPVKEVVIMEIRDGDPHFYARFYAKRADQELRSLCGN